VTSRLLGTSSGLNVSEALLLIDDPGVGLPTYGASVPQTLCGDPSQGAKPGGCQEYVGSQGSTPFGYGGFSATNNLGVPVAGSPTGGAPGANVFQGTGGGNELFFYGIPVLPPAVAGAYRSYRITNIRVDAALLNPVFLAVVVPSGSSLNLENSQLTLGVVVQGLTFQRRTPDDQSVLTDTSFSRCTGVGFCQFATLRFGEEFAQAFKMRETGSAPGGIQDVPGTIYGTESGFFNPALLPTAGLADFGTRLKAVFVNIPAGVNIWVGTGTAGASSATAQAVLTATEAGPLSPVASEQTLNGIPAVQLPIVNGTATAVWEVTGTSTQLIENFDFPVWLNNAPATGVANITGSLAPTADQGAFPASGEYAPQGASYPVPRFVTAPLDALPQIPSSQIAVTSSGLMAGRGSTLFSGTATMTNIGASTLTGPFQVGFFFAFPPPGAAGATLANASGWSAGTWYITLNSPATLAPGQSATFPVKFNNPTNAAISCTTIVYSGSIQ
jgi:hypothetical protein